MSETLLTRGPLVARLASVPEDVDAAQALRFRAFRDPDGTGRDADPFDATCDHLLVERDGTLVCTFRFQLFEGGAAAQAGQAEGVGRMEAVIGLILDQYDPLLELGAVERDCGHADVPVATAKRHIGHIGRSVELEVRRHVVGHLRGTANSGIQHLDRDGLSAFVGDRQGQAAFVMMCLDRPAQRFLRGLAGEGIGVFRRGVVDRVLRDL